MSIVTNVIITAHAVEAFERADGSDHFPAIEALEKAMEADHARFVEVSDQAGGCKAFEGLVFICAFNYLHLDRLRALLPTIPWELPEAVVVLAMEQEDDCFRVIWKGGD